ILQNRAQQRVYYLTAEEFTNELVYAIKNKTPEEFKNKYRRMCDVLVLEEIQFLSGKEKIQSELSYTLDCLIENKKKVVFTSAQLPKDIPRLGRQFASRLSNSLISTIEAPGYETRLKILAQNVRENKLNVPDGVLEFLARRATKDVRHLESCLTSLAARSKLLDRPIDMDLAHEILGDLVESTDSTVELEAIKKMICKYYQVSADDLLSRSRRRNVVLPRNIGMYLSRRLTELSLETIGHAFGRNHSTVMYAINLIEQRSRRDPKLQGQVDFLARQLNPSHDVSL
ncbi:MAG: chromosomal replication initiator protein DnaA, partial [Deltaproteobacteria bacterium]|nr:chromosomal replication initiator protein DnaA [Deltaproteobacteria bacterium]